MTIDHMPFLYETPHIYDGTPSVKYLGAVDPSDI